MSIDCGQNVSDLDVQRRKRTRSEVVDRLLDATVDALRQSPLDGLTVGDVAARAGISTASAAEMFPSIDQLVVETCLRRIRGIAVTAEASHGSLARVAEQLSRMMLVVAEEPAIASACATVFLHSGPTANLARESIGLEIHRLITSAMGPGSWPEVITTLEFVFSGALIQAAAGTMSFECAAERLETAVGLILGGAPPR